MADEPQRTLSTMRESLATLEEALQVEYSVAESQPQHRAQVERHIARLRELIAQTKVRIARLEGESDRPSS